MSVSTRCSWKLAWCLLVTAVGCYTASAKDNWFCQYKLDWFSWADTKVIPYMSDGSLRSLCDNNLDTGAGGVQGPEVGLTLEICFPQPIEVTEVRIVQQGADALEITADMDGQRKFEKVVARLEIKDKANQERKLLTLPVNKTVHGLKMVAMDGVPGYRSPYPFYREIEIYATTNIVSKLEPEACDNVLTLGPVVPVPKVERRQIEFTPCTDFWMTGLGDASKVPTNYLTEIVPAVVRQLREIDATGIRCFPETSCCVNKMPWKSKLCPNYGTEALKAQIDALHQNGLTCSYHSHAWISPIQKEGQLAEGQYKRWDYPYEQSDFIFTKGLEKYYKVKYPCMLSESDFRDKWLGIMSEVVERGIDRIHVVPDEFYFKNHYLPKTDCAACRAEFKKRYGYDDLPKKEEDTEPYRKWQVFSYEKLAEVFNYVAGELNKQKPGLPLIYSAGFSCDAGTRMEHGVAVDIMGAQPNFTEVMVNSGEFRQANGAFRGKKMFGALAGFGYENCLPAVMNGCTGILFWRLWNEMQGDHGNVVIKASKMMRLLDAWDVARSRSAAETCVLMSRASEDWWQLANDCQLMDYLNAKNPGLKIQDIRDLSVVWSREQKLFKPDDRVRSLQYERFRGMYSLKNIESVLGNNGIQYDVRYSERPDTLDDLSGYKLVILPFSYSMPTATCEALKKAVAAGTKLLIYGPLAPTDLYGNQHPKPLLESLVGQTNVTHLKTDLMKEWTSHIAQRENLAQIRTLLNSGYYFNPNGMSVHYLLRKVADDDLIVYLKNWEGDKTAEPILGLPVPQGNYSVTVCSTDQFKLPSQKDITVNQGLVRSKDVVVSENLKKVKFTLAPGEIQLVHIRKCAP